MDFKLCLKNILDLSKIKLSALNFEFLQVYNFFFKILIQQAKIVSYLHSIRSLLIFVFNML
jgi:hypothetical protein